MDPDAVSAAWSRLQELAEVPRLGALFGDDPERATRYRLEVADLRVDYSKQRITDEVGDLVGTDLEEPGAGGDSGSASGTPVSFARTRVL